VSTGILMLAGETPLPPTSGLRQRVLHLARALGAAFEVELVVLGEVPAAAGEPFVLRGVPQRRSRRVALAASLLQPYEAAKVGSRAARRVVERGRWASVQVELPFIAPIANGAGAPLVLDAHNVERDVLRGLARADPRPLHRVRWRWEARKTERLERSVVAAAAAVCATSPDDAAVLEELGARRIVLVPNGVDCAEVPHSRPASGCGLVYVGHYGYRPNLLAAGELVDEILPRVRASVPEAAVTLVGREATRRLESKAGEAVRLAGDVPDVLPHLRSARALVLPLRSGSGTRLKVLEALAAGVPVVSTALGVAGLGLRDGVEVLLGETPGELAAQTVRVLSDDELATRLSEDGRRLVEARYDWSVVARPLVELHASLGAGEVDR
jgi:glycosyltransferase involved in cell wall biosynthesis